MTELKIKQADINNNGNQRLMGENRGRGETQNMYHVQLWLYVYRKGVGCESTWYFVWGFFFPLKYVKYEIHATVMAWCVPFRKSSYMNSIAKYFTGINMPFLINRKHFTNHILKS